MSESLFTPTLRALEGVVERAEREPSVSAVRTSASGWSVGEHLVHVSLANRTMAAAVKAILIGGPEVEAGTVTSETARAMLAAGEIPRGVAPAPAGTEPGPERSDEELRELASQARADFRRLAAMEETIRTVPGAVAHPLLGPFTAAEWVRFAGIHTHHHLGIADEILGS